MTIKHKSDLSIGRPARISRETIAEAALTLGLDKVTLKKIAIHLGVDHSSLYRHVKNREEIIYSAFDLAICQLSFDNTTTDWKAYLHHLACSLWELYEKYQGLASTIRAADRTPPAAISLFTTTCYKLEGMGFSAEDAALVIDSIIDMTTDSASTWQQLLTPNKQGQKATERLSHSWQIASNSRTAKHVEYVISIISGEPKQWWLKKLTLLLAGAEAMRQG